MIGILGAALGGAAAGASYAGSENTNAANIQIAHQTNQMQQDTAYTIAENNYQEAMRARNWQEKMSNTAWQRGVEDMRKAGINPMAAFRMGGASTPSGAMGSGSGAGTFHAANVKNSIGQAVNSARETLAFKKELESRDAQIALARASASAAAQKEKLDFQNARAAKAHAINAEAEYPGLRARSLAEAASARIDEQMASFDARGGR